MTVLRTRRSRIIGLIGAALAAALLVSGCSASAEDSKTASTPGSEGNALPAAEGTTTYPADPGIAIRYKYSREATGADRRNRAQCRRHGNALSRSASNPSSPRRWSRSRLPSRTCCLTAQRISTPSSSRWAAHFPSKRSPRANLTSSSPSAGPTAWVVCRWAITTIVCPPSHRW